jgi:ABC-type bacteriocin/lantibiotic exporter with double-glycine peptidase domain
MILKIKPIKQLENHCGPACAKMVLQKYRIKKSQKELGIICNITETGVAPTAIVRCFKKFGIHSSYKHYPGIRKTVEQYLEEYHNPIIIGTEDHYLMIIGYTEKEYYIIDPADGKQSLMDKDIVYALMKDMIIIKYKIGGKK